jgi:hypothetical protein
LPKNVVRLDLDLTFSGILLSLPSNEQISWRFWTEWEQGHLQNRREERDSQQIGPTVVRPEQSFHAEYLSNEKEYENFYSKSEIQSTLAFTRIIPILNVQYS